MRPRPHAHGPRTRSHATPPIVAPSQPASRSRLAPLAAEQFDLLVIGGGITGAGVARDAAMRGLRTALVERDDFASGTSSRSSRLVHGGIRYLEHGELRLVFESSAERRTLLAIAPHLVRPLAFTWPVYAGARVSRWKLAAGLALYDALALFRNVARHARLGTRGVLAHEPRVLAEGLTGGARYWDAATDDMRLTLSTVLSARNEGAVVANHARVERLRLEGGRVAGATVADTLSEARVEVRARVVVNAAGPWSDEVERLADPASRPAVRGTKGVHVSVPRARIGNVDALTLLAPQDERVMFVLPAGDFAIIGTTDTYEAVSPDEVRANEQDVAYLLQAANHFFPSAKLTRDDVVSAWAGLRPLAAEGSSGGDDPSGASREHDVAEVTPGLVRVTGGKLTTYRAMAHEVVDAALHSLDIRRPAARTARVPLAGGELSDVGREVRDATDKTGDAAAAERLVHAHGSAWREVWRFAEAEPSLRERIDPARPYVMAELRHAVEHELALTLGDLLVRRTPVAFETRDHGRGAARRVLPEVARWLCWDERAAEAALAAYDAEVERIFRVERERAG
jgi:glycerol-3-phosphate dehydrogenase